MEQANNAAFADAIARPTLAMLGGFSASAVYRILAKLVESVEAQSYNMVEDSALVGRSIRVKCQIKPGVLPGYRKAVCGQC